MAEILQDYERCIDALRRHLGDDIAIGVPLGLGAPVTLINALYARAEADPSLRLRIFSALTLEKPRAKAGVERAFLEPFARRVFDGVPEPRYAADLKRGALPPNVRIHEFFFQPGTLLDSPQAQRDYISSNYTHAARDVFAQGCNCAAQLIARRVENGRVRYSLSSNPDTAPELVRMLRESGRPHRVIGVVNDNLPFMTGDAEVPADFFDDIVEPPGAAERLFSTPKLPVECVDHAIGLHASALVRDGGTLQIGIGAMGDAITGALLLRQRDNAAYRSALDAAGTLRGAAPLVEATGGTEPFARGLYGASEMFVDGFLHLYRAGILKRRVHDFWALQQALDDGAFDPAHLTIAVLDAMEALGVRALRGEDFAVLQRHGVFRDECHYEHGHITAAGGTRIAANLGIPASRAALAEQCLGRQLRGGAVLHAGFFLGPEDFYRALRALTDAERDEIRMCGVERVNQLDANPRLFRLQRRDARFFNTGLMCTLSGAVVSDGLADGRVISGVGGQYNFVAQAHHLASARSVLMVRAVRGEGAQATSNIVFNYGHCTIPRHLRDLVITEYGIADLRSRSDSEVAKALIAIADARFQPALLAQAQRAGKIEAGWRIPERARVNTREALERRLGAHRAALPDFPLGSDFTPVEQKLAVALKRAAAHAQATPKWRLLLKALAPAHPAGAFAAELERVNLARPAGVEARITRALLLEALNDRGF